MLKIGFISLGCSKNLVDTEMMIGLTKNSGYIICNNIEEADIILINTCGFINDAKEESINTIIEMIELKKEGKCKCIVVTGCLAKRYKEELINLLPEVDRFIGTDEYDNFGNIINQLVNDTKIKDKMKDINREITTPKYMAYLKIAEGCDNRCTYCAIPYIRGKYVSRTIEDILEEANKLYGNGVKELIIIAQDTTKYGIDIYGEYTLDKLLDKIAKIGFKWIRVLYTYPETINDNLIKVIKENKNICPYFDIPIQHISDSVLKRMGRKGDSKQIKEVINKIRNQIPNAIIRTTLIVGFPGETQEDFDKLYDFVKETKFNRLGVFKYSKEENTPAEKLDGHLHHKTKEKRQNQIMKLQQEISYNNNKEKIGKRYEMVIEEIINDGIFGRTYMDAPEIDGVVECKNANNKKYNIGDIIQVEIIDCYEYDLIGKII